MVSIIAEDLRDIFQDVIHWINNTFTEDAILPWMCIALPLWGYYFYLRFYNPVPKVPLDILALRNKYLSLSPPITSNEEIMIPIQEMYVYPVRGVRAGAQVDSIELGMHGVKYDREILLAAKEDKSIVTTNKYHVMGCLR